MKLILNYIIFPGFLFSLGAGALLSYGDRKLTARIQYRKGPPLLQPFYDIVKLFNRELIIPYAASPIVFLLAPAAALAGIVLVATLLGMIVLNPGASFVGDIIVVAYLMTVPSTALIIGAFASGNPLASLGASREIKLMLAYEFPFLLSLIVPIIKAGGAITLGVLLRAHAAPDMLIFSWSGCLSFLAAAICLHAKFGAVPFDMAEAETEVMGGVLIEYSGSALGLFKLAKLVALYTLPLFLVLVYLGGIGMNAYGLAQGALKLLGLVIIMTLVRNTNPRVKIDQAIRFFWGPVTICACIAVALAVMGL